MHMQMVRSGDVAEAQHLIDHPAYTPTVAARYLRLPVSTGCELDVAT